MKTGFESKRNVIILVVLLVVLIVCVWYFVSKVYGGGSPSPAPKSAAVVAPEPASRPSAESRAADEENAAANGHAAKKVPSLESLDPTLHPELMAGAEALEYAGSGRNIFSMSSAPPPIEVAKGPVRPQQTPEEAARAAGPPPPPPIDLTFFGYEADGSKKKAFILHGDNVFIASEGDVVDHHYKVLKINPLSIQVTDLLYNNTQTLNLSQS
ncbi:MAG TPA: hypothetical protein VIY53_00860 [Acidobacteriaceae bacterium]